MLIWDEELLELHKRYKKILEQNEAKAIRLQKGLREVLDAASVLVLAYKCVLGRFVKHDKSNWAASFSSFSQASEKHARLLSELASNIQMEFIDHLDEFVNFEFKLSRLLMQELVNEEKEYEVLREKLEYIKKRNKLKESSVQRLLDAQLACQSTEENLIRKRSEIMVIYDDIRKKKLSTCLGPISSLVSSYDEYFRGCNGISMLMTDYFNDLVKLREAAMENIAFTGRNTGSMSFFHKNKWMTYWFSLGNGKELSYFKSKKSSSRVVLGHFTPSAITELQISTATMLSDNDNPIICIMHESIPGVVQFKCRTFDEHKRWVSALVEEPPPVVASIEAIQGISGDMEVGISPPRFLKDGSRTMSSKSFLFRNISFAKIHRKYDEEYGSVLKKGVDDPKVRMLSVPGNEHCVDCYSIAPQYALPKYGILMCDQCSKLHENDLILPMEGTWNQMMLEIMTGLGNKIVNSILEEKPSVSLIRPYRNASESQRRNWMEFKYLKKAMMISLQSIGGDNAILDEKIDEIRTELLSACLNGDLFSILRCVLLVDPNSFFKLDVDESSSFPLAAAVSVGNIAAVQFLLLWNAEPNAKHPTSGNTALHYASLEGNKEMYNFLVRNGADSLIENIESKKAKDLFVVT